MPDAVVTPEYLASALASRLIHDAMGPASGIVSAFDLIADPSAAEMRDEALVLAADSARRLVSMLSLSRAIYGGGAALNQGELSKMATGLFDGSRARLTLMFDGGEPTAASGRILLGLLQIAAEATAAGGTVTANHDVAEEIKIVVEAAGPRLRSVDEIAAGLSGDRLKTGTSHRWVLAYMMDVTARSAGGDVTMHRGDGGIAFHAAIGPASAKSRAR